MDKNKQLTYGLGSLGVLLGGLSVFLMSERGRQIVRNVGRHLNRAPETIEQFADATLRKSWIDDKGMTVFSLWSPAMPGTEVDVFVASRSTSTRRSHGRYVRRSKARPCR